MSDHPLSDDQFNALLRVIRETIRAEIRDEFEARKAMAEWPAPKAPPVPTHVAGTPV